MWREEREQREDGDGKKKKRRKVFGRPACQSTSLLSDENKSSRITQVPPVDVVSRANCAD